MDLGATLCTRARPRCADCPIAADCRARIEGRQRRAAGARSASAPRASARRAVMLVARRDSRSAAGAASAERHLGRAVVPAGVRGSRRGAKHSPHTSSRARRSPRAPLPDIEHSFTHFDLVITPRGRELPGRRRACANGRCAVVRPQRPARVGLPAPIKTLLGNLVREKRIMTRMVNACC